MQKAGATLTGLVQMLVRNHAPAVAVPILCYVATIHKELTRKALIEKADGDTAFGRLLRLQLSDMVGSHGEAPI